MSYPEYAALARELSARQRGGEQAIAAEAEQRRALRAGVDQLGQRLAAQGQRLEQLGRAIGAAPPATTAEPVDRPAPVAAPPGGSAGAPGSAGQPSTPGSQPPATGSRARPPATGSPGQPPATRSPAQPPATGSPAQPPATGSPGQPPATGAGATGGAAAAPGRPGVGAYPQGSLPGPRAGDAATELAAARQLADEADRYGQQAEALAHRPVLLPTWSPLGRAVGVYVACALTGSVLMLATLVGSPLPVSGLDLVAAGACAGVPLLSFLVGQLVLARWGRPVLGGDPPPARYVPLGFVLCALLSSGLFCLYLVAFRLLR